MNVDNVAIIKDLYAKFALQDYEAIRNMFSENIEWNQMDGFPNDQTIKTLFFSFVYFFFMM